MSYPDTLLYDYYAFDLADKLGLETMGQPLYDIAENVDETTGYRFAFKPHNGTLYVKFDRDKV